MGNIVIGGAYVSIALVCIVMELMPRIQTETIWAKLGLAGVAMGSLVMADKFI